MMIKSEFLFFMFLICQIDLAYLNETNELKIKFDAYKILFNKTYSAESETFKYKIVFTNNMYNERTDKKIF